jgi:hypothetical protein
VSARSTALVGIAALAVLTGCAAAPLHKSVGAVVSQTASAEASPSAASISALVAQLGPQVQGAVNAAPRIRGTDVEALSTFTDMGGTPCPAGTVRDFIVAGLQLPNGGTGPNPAPAAKTYLESKGWRFGGWASEGPAPTQGGDQIAKASRNGVTMLITYDLFTFQVGATLPCLPGKVIPMG